MSMFREEAGRRRVNLWLVAVFSVISLPYLWYVLAGLTQGPHTVPPGAQASLKGDQRPISDAAATILDLLSKGIRRPPGQQNSTMGSPCSHQ